MTDQQPKTYVFTFDIKVSVEYPYGDSTSNGFLSFTKKVNATDLKELQLILASINDAIG